MNSIKRCTQVNWSSPQPTRDSASQWLLRAGLLGLAVVLALSACARKANKALAGNWQASGSKETMEFRNDGTCTGTDSYGRPVQGKFKFVDTDHMMLEISTVSTDKVSGAVLVDNASGICRVVTQGDSMILDDGHGSVQHYRRTK